MIMGVSIDSLSRKALVGYILSQEKTKVEMIMEHERQVELLSVSPPRCVDRRMVAAVLVFILAVAFHGLTSW